MYFLENKESKRIAVSDDYIQAQIYISEGEKNKAKIFFAPGGIFCFHFLLRTPINIIFLLKI